MANPTHEEWSALYQAATALKQLGPWEWMIDSELFGVRDPETGEVGYCCVMGNLGEHYALGVYRGSEGLDGYIRIQNGEFLQPNISALYVQKCLMASFEDREFIEKPDLAVIRELSLRFRGRNAWPLFRSYEPGYMPWYLNDEEARFLTHALKQTIEVSQRLRNNPEMLTPPRLGEYLVRNRNAAGEWEDTWAAPAPLDQHETFIPQFDEVRVERIRQSITARQGSWDVATLLLPDAVRDEHGGRPFFPYIFLWVDRHSGMVLPPQIAAPEEYQAQFQENLLDLIEQAGFMPQEIGALEQEPIDLLQPIADRLGIKMRLARSLPALEDARNGLAGYFLEEEEE